MKLKSIFSSPPARVILPLLFYILWEAAATAATLITATVTVTNTSGPTNGMSLVVNGDTRTWVTNLTSPASQILVTNSIGGAATNLFLAIARSPFSGMTLARSGTNGITLQTFPDGPCSVSLSAGWGALTLATNTLTPAIVVRIPTTVESAPVQTNVNSGLVAAIDSASVTNALHESSPAVVNLVGITNAQTVQGAKAFTNSLGLWQGTVSNSPGISGNAVTLTNGYYTNGIFDRPKLTNGVNYGNAFSSPGSASLSEQFGATAAASGSGATAVGYGAVATNQFAAAFGAGSAAFGGRSIALGGVAVATNSIALGQSSFVSGTQYNSIAIGYGAQPNTSNQVMIGAPGISAAIHNSLAVGDGGTFFHGITNLLLSGKTVLPENNGSIAFRRHPVASLATGDNAAVPVGTNSFVEVSGPAGPFAINGIDAQPNQNGHFLILLNRTGRSMTMADQSGVEPIPGNRVSTLANANITVSNNSAAMLIYSAAVQRWQLLYFGPEFGTNAGGGGGGSTNGGTVESVSLSAPSIFGVTGSPVTDIGTLGFTNVFQTKQTVFAGPTNGGNAEPAFRSLTVLDLPIKPGANVTLSTNFPNLTIVSSGGGGGGGDTFWITNTVEGGIWWSNGGGFAKLAADLGGAVGEVNSFAEGWTNAGGTIRATWNGAVSMGAALNDLSLIDASQLGAIALGHVDHGSDILSQGLGSMAGGSGGAGDDGTGGGQVKASETGARAWGSSDNLGELWATGIGADASGQVDHSAIIQAGPVGKGASAGGMANNSGIIYADADGARAHGKADTSGELKALGAGATALGVGLNSGLIHALGVGSFVGGIGTNGALLSAEGAAGFTWGDNVGNSGDFAFAYGRDFTNANPNTFNVGWAATPTIVIGPNGETNNSLTASKLVGTDANKALNSITVGSGLTLSGTTLSASGSGGTVTGSGTANQLPLWTSSTGLGDSVLDQSGSYMVEMRNGTAPVSNRVYATYTDATHGEYLQLGYLTTLGGFVISATNGTAGGSSRPIYFATKGGNRLELDLNGSLLPLANNTQIFGGAANQWNSAYINQVNFADGSGGAPNLAWANASIFANGAAIAFDAGSVPVEYAQIDGNGIGTIQSSSIGLHAPLTAMNCAILFPANATYQFGTNGSGTDNGSPNSTFRVGASTGTGTGGAFIVAVATNAATTASTVNGYSNRLAIGSSGVMTNFSLLDVQAPSLSLNTYWTNNSPASRAQYIIVLSLAPSATVAVDVEVLVAKEGTAVGTWNYGVPVGIPPTTLGTFTNTLIVPSGPNDRLTISNRTVAGPTVSLVKVSRIGL